ncbi:MAG: AAA family ATPase [Desulfobacterales bacterium]|nr:AAA family ATPase [Desulfobacterales bacterium]
MLKHLLNPLSVSEGGSTGILSNNGLGAVLSRAGVGKTSLLVQFAIHSLFNNRKVLHISLDDSVKKIHVWHKEIFRSMATDIDLPENVWEKILSNRFIMTFRVEGFSVPKLEERLSDLIEQKIFKPDMMIIDGLPFDENISGSLEAIKKLSEKINSKVWFTVRTHRHEEIAPNGLPTQIADFSDMFEYIINLNPQEKEIKVEVLKGRDDEVNEESLYLDPSSLLLFEK